MKKLALILIVLFSILLVLGCTTGGNNNPLGGLDPYQNDKVVVAFYNAVKTKDYASITPYCSEIYLEEYPPAAINSNLAFVNSKLGDLQSYTVVNSESQAITNLDGTESTTTSLTINTTYAKGSAVEYITLTTRSGEEQLDWWAIDSKELPQTN